MTLTKRGRFVVHTFFVLFLLLSWGVAGYVEALPGQANLQQMETATDSDPYWEPTDRRGETP